jgi:hypothetical protein
VLLAALPCHLALLHDFGHMLQAAEIGPQLPQWPPGGMCTLKQRDVWMDMVSRLQ